MYIITLTSLLAMSNAQQDSLTKDGYGLIDCRVNIKRCNSSSFHKNTMRERSQPGECNLFMDEQSRIDIVSAVEKRNNGIIFHLSFCSLDRVECKENTHVFDYSRWIWLYKGATGAYFFVHEPIDVDFLSLGMSDIQIANVDALIIIGGGGGAKCIFSKGSDEYDKKITKLLHDAVQRASIEAARIKSDIIYTSAYCYMVYKNMSAYRSVQLDNLDHIFQTWTGTIDYFSRMKCYESIVNLSHVVVGMRDSGPMETTPWYQRMRVLGIMLLLYSPFLLSLLPERGTKSDFNMIDFNETENETASDDFHEKTRDDWITGSTLTVSSLLTKIYYFGGDGACVRRLRRGFLFLIIPLLTVGPFLWHYHSKLMWYTERHKSLDSPLGLLALLVDFESALVNWRYFLGGPHITVLVTLILGVIVLCVPYSMSTLLTTGLITSQDPLGCNKSPVFMTIPDLARYASTNINRKQGYSLIVAVFSSRIKAMLNKAFWQQCFFIWIHRLRKTVNAMSFLFEHPVLKIIMICTLPFVLLCHFILIFVEFLVIILHNGIPIIGFMCLLYAKYFKFIQQTMRSVTPLWRNGLATVFLILLAYVSYGYLLLIVTTFTLFTLIFDFTLMGFIINVSVLIMYVTVSTVILIYAWKSTSGMLEEYEFIFTIITDVAIQFEMKQKTLPTVLCEGDESMVNQPFESGYEPSIPADEPCLGKPYDEHRYVKEIDGLPAIPKTLFYRVVEQHKPLRNNIAKAILKFLITCLITVIIITIVLSFHRETVIGEIMQLFGVVLTGLLPLILRVFQSPFAHMRSVKKFEHVVSRTVEHYFISTRREY